jgi:hypothetical protein
MSFEAPFLFEDGRADAAAILAPVPAHIGKIYDLAGGEARLREVMDAVLADISPRVSALISKHAAARQLNYLTDKSGNAATAQFGREKAKCLNALSPMLERGKVNSSGAASAAGVDLLTKDLKAEVPNWMQRGERWSSAHLILATPGLGKTRSVQALIEALPSQAVVWVFQPTLRKADEFARDMAGSSRPVRVFRGRGAPVASGAAELMCIRHAMAAKVAAQGLSVKKMLCGSLDQSVGGACPYSTSCAYQTQLRAIDRHAGGGVFVMTHASLTQPPAFPQPHLVIIDEDPSASLPQSIPVAAQALSPQSDWISLLEDDIDDSSRHTRLSKNEGVDLEDVIHEDTQEAVLDTFELLLKGLAANMPLREIATTIEIAELEEALNRVRKLERKLRNGLTSGGSDDAFEGAIKASPVKQVWAVRVVLIAVLREVRLFCAGVIDRPVFNGLSINRDDNGDLRSVTVYRLANTAIKQSVPVIVLDGTADPELIGRALRRRMTVWRIDVARQGEVIQCLGRSFSTGSLAPNPGYPLPASASAERERLWQELTTVLRREFDSAPKGVLVVSTLAVEIEAQRHCNDLLQKGLVWTHFGATRGINKFTDLQTIVIIGRKQPPAPAVEAIARAYFATHREPIEPEAQDYVVRHRRLHGKRDQVNSTKIQTHPDLRINRVLWQMREAEVIQAIDRVRAARFPRKILLLNGLDLRRPDDDLGRPGLGVPADLYISWPDLRSGGNRAETVLAVSGGFLPVAPKALARIAPEVFPSVDAAKKWLQRTNLDEALTRHSEHLTQMNVRPAGQRGAAWPLLVDRRHFACPISARAAFEARLDTRMAVWAKVD